MDGNAETDVILIGAGPGGLATAKAMVDEGLEPIVLEASDAIGGQWHTSAPHSGVWAGMNTNTSRATTVFSDLPHLDGTPLFPSALEIQAYLERYAETFDLNRRVQLESRVTDVERMPDGFCVRVVSRGERRTYHTPRVVVVSGRYNRPELPAIEGIDAFAGHAIHAFEFRDPAEFAGRKVLVLGNSISGLEIAAELAKDASTEVVSACRKPRYIIQKLKDDVPADWRWFNRAAHFVGRTLPPEEASAGLREQVLALHGNPADFGGLAPSEDMMEAGLGQCQDYLPLVAKGRIRCQSLPARIEGHKVTFADGTEEDFDAIIAGTGYPLHLPFLSEDLRTALRADDEDLDLFEYTFAPAVPNLAFVGQFKLVGPYFPVVELQGRLAAMVFTGARSLPDLATRQTEADALREMLRMGAPLLYHDVAVDLARAAGVEPDVTEYPALAGEFVFGPIVPSQFRLSGHGADSDGEARFRAELARLGRDPAAPLPEEIDLLRTLAAAEAPYPAVLGALHTLERD